ncbi:unnamed protein product [Paramecium pentaurelia]|uniref:Uncharacterized protein n=1 Tax=Paramecium pentaurelia TaxID=43138 RepID=A0A8S1TQG2_9CILI|nr:unnamed protein product [Paramecium pentaurelia]
MKTKQSKSLEIKKKESSNSFNQSQKSQQSIQESENYDITKTQEVNFQKIRTSLSQRFIIRGLIFWLLNYNKFKSDKKCLKWNQKFKKIQFLKRSLNNSFKLNFTIMQILVDKLKQQRYYLRQLHPIGKIQIDYDILQKDYYNYSQLAESKMQIILDSFQIDYIHRKNNIALGNIRFLFQTPQFPEFDYVFPGGKFKDLQFYDFDVFILENFKQENNLDDPILQFVKQNREQPSERAMILWLLVDVEQRKPYFNSQKKIKELSFII